MPMLIAFAGRGGRIPRDPAHRSLTLFLAGDVMTGRGIDQILPHPSRPDIYERWMGDARGYVTLAEKVSGPIPRRVDPAYIWGDALEELARVAPAARIVNLETSVTRSDDHWPGKGINYRMHPGNVGCLQAAALDVCVLANNHVLDYGYVGLRETLATLHHAGIRTAGAGIDRAEARRPAVVPIADDVRLLVYAVGCLDSGIPPTWAAGESRPGVDLVDDLSEGTADAIVGRVEVTRRPGDLVIVSVHWGGNWGYTVPAAHTRFAHRLIDGGVHLVHGHSSHHPRPLEIYRDRLILYGCGDLLDDYEGIAGYEDFRNDLALLYFPTLDAPTGALLRLDMTPMQRRRLQLCRAAGRDGRWMAETLSACSAPFGCTLTAGEHGGLRLIPATHRVTA